MPDTRRLTTANGVDLLMDATSVFGLLADLATWPQLFDEVVHTEVLEDESTRQLGRIWSVTEGRPHAWTSTRRLDWARRSITFQRVEPVEPIAFTYGEWHVVDRGSGRCRVLLRQDFTAEVRDDEQYERLQEQLGAAAVGQLHALRSSVHTGSGHADLQFEVRATTVLPFGPGRPDAIAQLARPELWTRLPHVRSAEAHGAHGLWNAGGHRVTVLKLDRVDPDGGSAQRQQMQIVLPPTTFRLDKPETPDPEKLDPEQLEPDHPEPDHLERVTHELVFKELDPPPSVAAHTGRWSVRAIAADKALVTVRHTVTLDAVGVFAQFGADVTLTQARRQVRDAVLTEDELLLDGLRDLVVPDAEEPT
ncbi:SRPBCC family protein [Streptacidiphilus sp. MAP5-3]|uniref:SRPBCC family protein n=1 Tax=unclassified Streptacidiphilus TaxID=2643834 RepID=UPI003519C1D4